MLYDLYWKLNQQGKGQFIEDRKNKDMLQQLENEFSYYKSQMEKEILLLKRENENLCMQLDLKKMKAKNVLYKKCVIVLIVLLGFIYLFGR